MRVVLVVDDEPMVLRLMVRILTEAGFKVHAAADALQALEVAVRMPEPADVLVTDLRMEPVDGADLAKLIVRQWPGVQVLYVSGFDADRLGIPGPLLRKPFSPEQLIEAVRNLPGQNALSSTPA
jgi:two-component system, cell cycle sensor histidine kinase and response regulator CckA